MRWVHGPVLLDGRGLLSVLEVLSGRGGLQASPGLRKVEQGSLSLEEKRAAVEAHHRRREVQRAASEAQRALGLGLRRRRPRAAGRQT